MGRNGEKKFNKNGMKWGSNKVIYNYCYHHFVLFLRVFASIRSLHSFSVFRKFMSGHACPLCRHLYPEGANVKPSDKFLRIHIEQEHGQLGMLQGRSVHCPVIGCGMMFSSMSTFTLHCEQRHYNSDGPYRCEECPQHALPFNGREQLSRHLMIEHQKMLPCRMDFKKNGKSDDNNNNNNKKGVEYGKNLISQFPVKVITDTNDVVSKIEEGNKNENENSE